MSETTTGGAIENATAAPPDNHSRELNFIKQKIKYYQKDCEQSYLEIGRLLLRVKLIYGGHGEWLSWIKANTELSVCKAQRLMKVAKWLDGNEALVPHSSFTKVYLLSRLSSNELKVFLKDNQIEEMSKQRLESAIRDFLKTRSRKSASTAAHRHAESGVSTGNDVSVLFDRVKRDVSNLAELVENEPKKYGPFAAELCAICQTIVQQLAPQDIEII